MILRRSAEQWSQTTRKDSGMYFTGHMTVDPNDITEVVQARPSKGFFRLAQQISRGLEDKNAERESFAAVSILQRVNIALRSLGITNILHLSKDGYLVYEDKAGVEDDFKLALIEFGRNTDAEQRREFRVLTLALEHPGELLEFLIEIEIVKLHRVGEFPINITVNGVFREFVTSDGQLSENAKSGLAAVFQTQSGHDAVQSAAEVEFREFMSQLEIACQSHLRVDDLHLETKTKVLKRKRKRRRRGVLRGGLTDPIFYEHYHWHDHTVYVEQWSDHYDAENCMLHHCEVIDEDGTVVAEVGEDHQSLDQNAAEYFEGATSEDASNHEYEVESSGEFENEQGSDASLEVGTSSDDQSSSGGWLSGLFGGGDGDSNSGWFWGSGDTGDDGGSSCGGCGGE
jgi:hypothetical protein